MGAALPLMIYDQSGSLIGVISLTHVYFLLLSILLLYVINSYDMQQNSLITKVAYVLCALWGLFWSVVFIVGFSYAMESDPDFTYPVSKGDSVFFILWILFPSMILSLVLGVIQRTLILVIIWVMALIGIFNLPKGGLLYFCYLILFLAPLLQIFLFRKKLNQRRQRFF